MNSNSTSRMPMLAGVGLALAAILLLLPAHGHAATLNVTDDSYVKESNTSKNFGNKKVVKVDGNKDLTGFAKFDLSVLGGAVGADIDTATLRIFVSKVKDGGSIDIHQVTGADWDEGTINAGNAPAFGASLVTVGIGTGDKNEFVLINADVTTLVKAWLDGTDNFGIAIEPAGARIEIDSKENSKTSHPMEIEVTTQRTSIEAQEAAGIGQIIGGGTGGNNLNPTDSTIEYVPMFHGHGATSDADEATSVMPLEGVVSDLHVLVQDDPGEDVDSYTFTIQREPVSVAAPGEDGNTDTLIECFVDGDDDDDFTCIDLEGDTQCYKVGDGIVVKVFSDDGDTLAAQAATWTAIFRPGACTPACGTGGEPGCP